MLKIRYGRTEYGLRCALISGVYWPTIAAPEKIFGELCTTSLLSSYRGVIWPIIAAPLFLPKSISKINYMNKKNEILVAETIQKLAEGFEGKISYQLYEDNRKSFFGTRVLHHETILEIRLQEGVAEVKKNGRPVGSVKTLAV
jgi:hypothetical protein